MSWLSPKEPRTGTVLVRRYSLCAAEAKQAGMADDRMMFAMKKQRIIGLVMLGLTILMCVGMLSNCFGLGKSEVEIVPGLTWTYYYVDKVSCLRWEGFGVAARGTFDLAICDYGLCVWLRSGNSKPLYLDLREKRVVEWACVKPGTNLWEKVGVVFSTDVQSAMGVYCESSRVEFEQALDGLRGRLRKQDDETSR